jgi:hypothetical protein
MKVQLVVVQGKPEGKIIPLAGPVFRIGRGETCHLRPNSEQVSREHAEFSVSNDQVQVRDMGSRNGTLVNGKAIEASTVLKDRDLIQVGPQTFAISIQGVPAAVVAGPKPAPAKPKSPDDISHADIESWLVSDASNPTPDRPSGVYGGDTETITAYRSDQASNAAGSHPVDEEEEAANEDEGADENDSEENESEDEPVEELVDESNPFNKAKSKQQAPAKPASRDSSDAASDILRKMMERRRGS